MDDVHVTSEELADAARAAWRNADRCIGRLYWHSLIVRDMRQVRMEDSVFDELIKHLMISTNNGRVRSVATVLHPSVHILNEQLIGYAGYRCSDGSILGDPRHSEITKQALALGWPGGRLTSDGDRMPKGRFDILPLLISIDGRTPTVRELPAAAVCEVSITHPEYPWFGELGLRWYAVGAITDMRLWLTSALAYPAAFGGWWLATGIASRELADAGRYNALPSIAEGLGLDTSSPRTLWMDRAEHELTRAVLHSYDEAGVRITDHHTESARFLAFVANEHKAGRVVRSEWSWIVPTQASARLGVFHTSQEPPDPTIFPSFRRVPPPNCPLIGDAGLTKETSPDGCPVRERPPSLL